MNTSIRQLVRSFLLVMATVAAGTAHAALTINVELNPNPVRPNEVMVGQLTVTNTGGAPVAGVVIQATIPANVANTSVALASPAATCIQSNNVTSCDPGELVNWAIGTIPAGGGVTVSMPFTVLSSATAGTVITLAGNVLIVAASQATANASVTVSTTNALSLSVEEDQNPVAPDKYMTYTLTYGNRGATTSVTGTTLTFPIPAGATFYTATGGGVLNGSNNSGTVVWNLGTLPATQSGQQQVVLVTNGNVVTAGSVLSVNAVTITGTSLVAESAQATAITRIAAPAPTRTIPALGLAIEMNPDPVRPNEQLTVQFTVTNRGTTALTGVVLQARMPAVALATSIAVSAGATCVQANNVTSCDPTELVNWVLGTLPAGAGVTLSLPLIANSTTTPGRLVSMEALARDDSGNGAVAGDAGGVDSDDPLTLSVNEDLNPVEAGFSQLYTLTYGNRGATASVTGTTLTFPLPLGWTLVSATGGGTQVGTNLQDQRVQWTLGSLPAGQIGQQRVTVAPAGSVPGDLISVNSAVIAGTTLNAESSRATAVSRISTAQPPLALAVEMNPDPVRPGELTTVQLTVTNSDSVPLTGVVLQARMPEGVNSINTLGAPGAACTQANNTTTCDQEELLSWTLGAIPGGGGITLSVPLIAVSGVTNSGRLITVEALVKDDGARQAVVEKTIGVDADDPLWLAVDDDKNPVRQLDVVTYTLTYGNRAASSSLAGTQLTFPIPDGSFFVSATGGGTLVGNTVQWNLGSFAATQADQQQVVVQAAGSAINVNAATITGTGVLTESARANAVTRVDPSDTGPPLSLAIEANPDPARPNEQLITEFTVTNRSATPLTGVVLQARIPQTVNSINIAGTTLGGTCVQLNNTTTCDSTELAKWSLGTIPAGAGVTVSMPLVIVAGATPGQLLTLEALASDDGTNRAVLQQTIAVDNNNPLTLAVDEERDAVPGGSLVTYNLTYGNRGASGSETGTTLSFPLPVEAVLLGSTGGSVVDGNVVWNLGSIAAGAGGRRKVTLSVPGDVTLGTILRIDAAQMHGNVVAGTVPDAVRATTATRVEASQPLGLSAVWAPDPVLAAGALTGTLTVTNNSGGTLTGVVLQARMPQSVNSVTAATAFSGGGTCVQLNNTASCDFTELGNWAIGTMVNGAQATFTMALTVTAGTTNPNGRLITIESLVKDDSGRLSTLQKSVLLNPFTDTDGDTVAQIFDNCTLVANPTQVDSDYDGYGNRCDGDLNNNGFTNGADTTLFRQQLGQPSVAPTYNKADINANGFVNSQDTTLFRVLLGAPPGPSGLAP